MIKQETKEYSEDGLAVRTIRITLFGVPIYRFKETSTNKAAVAQLAVAPKLTKVKGFSYETKNKSKKNK